MYGSPHVCAQGSGLSPNSGAGGSRLSAGTRLTLRSLASRASLRLRTPRRSLARVIPSSSFQSPFAASQYEGPGRVHRQGDRVRRMGHVQSRELTSEISANVLLRNPASNWLSSSTVKSKSSESR